MGILLCLPFCFWAEQPSMQQINAYTAPACLSLGHLRDLPSLGFSLPLLETKSAELPYLMAQGLNRELGQTGEGIICSASSEIHSPNPELTELKTADFPNVLKLAYFSCLSPQME